ncbi:MAG TPA: SAM-dependent methyltransferase [Anaerolineae bacterium]|nr:SAM-dependent methyltransferase [Anaerolineae bacterium]
MTNDEMILGLVEKAIAVRADLFDLPHEGAFRLFNGFREGFAGLSVDLFGKTLVLHNYAKPPENGEAVVKQTLTYLLQRFDWIEAAIVKERWAVSAEKRNGTIHFGDKPTRAIREHGVRYALDLCMNRDASFYLDTANLRHWLLHNCRDQSVLNTFAYTGSLGVAAMAGGASRVVQTDLNKRFLNVAKTSYTLNGFPIRKADFITGDFWSVVKRLNRAKTRFDLVLLDPPFFSETRGGTVDLAKNVKQLINKVRPLVQNEGRIVAINNALFFSGAQFMAALQELTVGGWVEIEQIVDVSADFTAYPSTRVQPPITDPAPFNHATKIAILRIKHKTA